MDQQNKPQNESVDRRGFISGIAATAAVAGSLGVAAESNASESNQKATYQKALASPSRKNSR